MQSQPLILIYRTEDRARHVAQTITRLHEEHIDALIRGDYQIGDIPVSPELLPLIASQGVTGQYVMDASFDRECVVLQRGDVWVVLAS